MAQQQREEAPLRFLPPLVQDNTTTSSGNNVGAPSVPGEPFTMPCFPLANHTLVPDSAQQVFLQISENRYRELFSHLQRMPAFRPAPSGVPNVKADQYRNIYSYLQQTDDWERGRDEGEG